MTLLSCPLTSTNMHWGMGMSTDMHTHTHIRRLPQKGGGFPSSCLPLGPTLKAQDPTKEMDVQGWVGSVIPSSLIF